MTTVTLDIPSVKSNEYKKVFRQFIRDYSIEELKEIQERNMLYKKLSIIEKDDKQTDKMELSNANKYLDNLF